MISFSKICNYDTIIKIFICFYLIIPVTNAQTNNKYTFKPSLISTDTLEISENNSNIKQLNDSLSKIQYIADSTIRINKIKDSINILKTQLAFILECYFKTNNENIPISKVYIQTQGDTILHKAGYYVLPFNLDQPYKPWIYEINLINDDLKVFYNDENQIVKITSKTININIEWHNNFLLIKNIHSILQNKYGNYYKIPIDSIFFDNNKNIIKIKKCVSFYNLINNLQKGNFLFTNTILIKQYFYQKDDIIYKLQIVNFSNRWYTYENQKVTSIIEYDIIKNNNIYTLTQKTDPVNNYADGKYIFEFDNLMNLKYINYYNNYTSEICRKEIELNKEGYVHCYYDYINEKLKQSLCIIYNYTKNSYETITTIFENDGISYYQRNNTTGKVRHRNRLTLEWGQWE